MTGFKTRIKGSVMGLVLTVAMLVTLMSAFLTLRSGLDAQTSVLYETSDRLFNNAGSGLQFLLSPHNPVPLNGNTTLDLFEEGLDSVYLERKAWGVFEIVISKAFRGKNSMVRKALIGNRPADTLTPTLYVADLEKPLSVCGHTQLKGICYVPAAGFKRAYIEGQNYAGDKYVYGTQLRSSREIPALNASLAEAIQLQLKTPVTGTDSVVPIESLSADSLVRAFDRNTLVLRSASDLHLPAIFISGNVKITAPKIFVSSGCRLNNVLLLADEIVIDDRCTLQVQAFARERITIGKEALLAYPSVLAVMAQAHIVQPEGEEEKPLLYLGENSTITGDIITWKEKKYLENEAWLSLDKATTIKGNVYVNGRLDVKGKIYGSTYCTRFFLKTNSGIYENHLLNAELDASKLPPYYTGAAIIHEGTRREVLQWL